MSTNPQIINLDSIAKRCQTALAAIRRGDLGAAVRCEQILTHDVTSLIAEIRYLRRCNAALVNQDTALVPRPPNHGR